MRFSAFLSLGLCCVICTGCSDRPKDVISDKKMVKIMADMEMAEAYLVSKGSSNNTSENRERIISYILEKNDVSRAQYDSTISWYGRHFDKYDELYARVDKELGNRARAVSGKAEEIVTTDLWQYPRRMEISPLSSSDNISFRITPDNNEKGERIDWKLNLLSSISANGILGVTYSDGISNYVTKSFSGNGNFELNFQTDTSRTIKNIFGNIRLTNVTAPVLIDSIRLEAIPFDSTEYYRIYSQKKYRGPVAKKRIIENDTVSELQNKGNPGEES